MNINVIDRAIVIREDLILAADFDENRIDSTLDIVPPFKGSNKIKII